MVRQRWRAAFLCAARLHPGRYLPFSGRAGAGPGVHPAAGEAAATAVGRHLAAAATATATASAWRASEGAAAPRVSGSPLERTSMSVLAPRHVPVPLAPDTRGTTSSGTCRSLLRL